jgi:hypothetical protein
MVEIVDYLTTLKHEYEDAITTGGREKVTSLIRSKHIINNIHEYVKAKLIEKGVNQEKIYPRVDETKPEKTMAGFLKQKAQDISILSSTPTPEDITEGVLLGKKDKIGKAILNSSISINVRSQLSSISKNFDTLYERTFAEPLNLHLRVPKLVMGEVYLIPLRAYNSKSMLSKKIHLSESLPIKYIPAFQKINLRESIVGNEYKYERACLLIVDFQTDPPTVINDTDQLIKQGILDEENADEYSLDNLTIDNFVEDILAIYKKRHGSLDPLR